ncbi:MAG: 6-bladed beta-propeller [Gemmatimonadota bacterium]|nr:6-bladed beta-propeller [Gemmatimonadota bacterium]
MKNGSRIPAYGEGRRSMALMLAALACFCAALPLPASAQLERWTLERTVTIGDAFDPETGLTRVGSVIVQGDRLLVAQPMEQRLRVFSLTGDFLGFIGRDGEGPGEFRRVRSMGLHDGRVWVHDSSLRRLQYFDADGRFVSSVRIGGHPALLGARVRAVLADGSMLFKYGASADELVESPPKPEAVFLVDPEWLPQDTVAVLVGHSQVVRLSDGRSGRTTYSAIPESYRSLLSVAPDGSGFVVVHRNGTTSAEPHTFRVIRFDARADTAWAREVPYDPVRVPGTWRSRQVEEDARDTQGLGIPEDRIRQALERAYARLEFFPPVRVVRAGADGSTWLLLRTGVESYEWEVLDESGHAVARVGPPQGGMAWADAESLWSVERDELGISYLVRYVIRRP